MTEAGLNRRDVVETLLADRRDLLVVAGLGAPAWDCTSAGDHPLTFPLWGAMGQAAMVGLGLALARPGKQILVITGDGETLMGLGALATIGVQRPANLHLVVIDNGRYGETGMQASHTAFGVDLVQIARGCGFNNCRLVVAHEEVGALGGWVHGSTGPGLAVVKVIPEALPPVLPPREGVLLKDRFRLALLGSGGRLDRS